VQDLNILHPLFFALASGEMAIIFCIHAQKAKARLPRPWLV
jgi:hypothetical protein